MSTNPRYDTDAIKDDDVMVVTTPDEKTFHITGAEFKKMLEEQSQ